MGRYTEAVDALKQSDQGNPFVHVWLVCAYSELGREENARKEAAQVLRVSPGFSLEGMRKRHLHNGRNLRGHRNSVVSPTCVRPV